MAEKKKIMRKERGLPVRSVRISNTVWSAAGRRARAEGIETMSYVVSLLVEAYANGLIALPKVQLVAQNQEQPTSPVEV